MGSRELAEVGGPRDATDGRQPGLRHWQRQRQCHAAETPVRAAQAWTADTAGDCQTNTGAGSLAVSKRIARLRVEDFSQTFPAMLLRLVGTADTAGDCEKNLRCRDCGKSKWHAVSVWHAGAVDSFYMRCAAAQLSVAMVHRYLPSVGNHVRF